MPYPSSSSSGSDAGPYGKLLSPPRIARHNVILAGLRRSGKSSILKVVYEQLSPSDTLFLESHSTGVKGRWTTFHVDCFLPLRIWDGPGPLIGEGPGARGRGAVLRDMPADQDEAASRKDFEAEAESTAAEVKEGKLRWRDVSTVIFVIDAQDDYFDCVARLHELILKSFAINPFIEYHVFVHKVDGLSDDYKFDTQRDVEQRLLDDLADASGSFAFVPGAAEEMAKAAQRGHQVGPQSFGLEGVSNSREIFPLESSVKLHFHLTSIFDNSVFVALSKVQQSLMEGALAASLESACDSICGSCRFDKAFLMDVPSRTYISSDSTPFEPTLFDMVCEYVNFLLLFSDVYSDLQPPASSSPATTTASSNEGQAKQGKWASSVCKLNPDISVCFWQVDNRLALIAIIKSDLQARNAGLIDYNVSFFRRAIIQIAQVARSA
ncbi:hypothetical protein K437DRAFT_227080 [Tilletiaria anomala UBC 951]|uniref:GTP-binding protein n=1 Tax=Tilletiaria anomala (strain ATCC 24038 / CBS 436.72 / UBC 951) TaxID=1037660 RepID=A0A066VHL6_TILAU|nr:uncharacterized protein K437DRAFT_227080 [Tilletiaria anomala UBC 951]KDN40976.1 hypothetical protein K437DRAFT_227080 [Tilletiaria anomala UBC 951]